MHSDSDSEDEEAVYNNEYDWKKVSQKELNSHVS
jgi:hypothetical protein